MPHPIARSQRDDARLPVMGAGAVQERRCGRRRSGWWIVAGGAILLTLQNGLIISAFGAYFVAITEDTGWDPRVIAIGFAIVQLGNGALSPVTGWCCDRLGTRAVVQIGTTVTAAGCALASRADGGGLFVGAVCVIALGCSAAGMTPLTVAVVQALAERRTLALGLLPSGVALGGLLVPAVVWSLTLMGWRATFLTVAVAIAVIGLVAGAVLPTNRTSDVSPPGEEVPSTPVPGHDLRSAVRTSAFWLLVAGHGSALMAVGAVNLHLIPLMTRDRGFSLAVASVAVAAMSVAQLVGQIITGMIGDHFDKRRFAISCMVVQTAVLVGLAALPGVAVVAAAVVHGLAWGLRGPIMNSLRADYFGLASFGTIIGWSMGFVSLGMMSGPLLATAIAGGVGGYPAAFGALATITALGTVAFLLLRPPRLAKPVTAGVRDRVGRG
ncbi:MFS transporter [Saccharopolyspora sp. K220]|uniref:MFS transporter n=1 Tax=Saccharopolyspora soli TaxID=2926618 RepID=UPI001F57A2DB|nr:MFS transporter [Saccharopolyspora soli]MCI2419548.1 MFS transporter [Saccharopolyspora soli]